MDLKDGIFWVKRVVRDSCCEKVFVLGRWHRVIFVACQDWAIGKNIVYLGYSGFFEEVDCCNKNLNIDFKMFNIKKINLMVLCYVFYENIFFNML